MAIIVYYTDEEVMDDEINQLRDVIRYIRREKTNRSAAAEVRNRA